MSRPTPSMNEKAPLIATLQSVPRRAVNRDRETLDSMLASGALDIGDIESIGLQREIFSAD